MLSSFSRYQKKIYNPLYSPYKNNLHYFSFNMPLSGAEMTGLDPLLCASSFRKIESDLKQKKHIINKNPFTIDNVDNNYFILPIVGIIFFVYYYRK